MASTCFPKCKQLSLPQFLSWLVWDRENIPLPGAPSPFLSPHIYVGTVSSLQCQSSEDRYVMLSYSFAQSYRSVWRALFFHHHHNRLSFLQKSIVSHKNTIHVLLLLHSSQWSCSWFRFCAIITVYISVHIQSPTAVFFQNLIRFKKYNLYKVQTMCKRT